MRISLRICLKGFFCEKVWNKNENENGTRHEDEDNEEVEKNKEKAEDVSNKD